MHPNVHYNTIYNSRTWKQPICPAREEWIKNWYMYTMECYLVIKRKEIVPFAKMWLDL